MDEVEIPQYFICPISLQIMKDPVTTVTGITYDRESIEHWLLTAEKATCPVTKQPLPRDSDLTPNHTLRRLIQAWCIANAENGIDQIPTPKSPLNKSRVFRLIRDIKAPQLYIQQEALKKMEELANENAKNRNCMVEAGTTRAMVNFIIKCYKEGRLNGLEEALSILHLLWSPMPENKPLMEDNFDFIESILWILKRDIDNHVIVKTYAMIVLKLAIEVVSSNLIESLNRDFFEKIVHILRDRISHQAAKAALHVLMDTISLGGNRMKIVEAGAVFELIELELDEPEKSVTELIFCLLAKLCSCVDGRAELLKHAGGIAMIAKRTLRVSPATDDQAIRLLALIARFSATNEVVLEMSRVGAVSKLCMVLQADCAAHLKKSAREILRLHSNIWNNSSCTDVYLLTRYPR